MSRIGIAEYRGETEAHGIGPSGEGMAGRSTEKAWKREALQGPGREKVCREKAEESHAEAMLWTDGNRKRFATHRTHRK